MLDNGSHLRLSGGKIGVEPAFSPLPDGERAKAINVSSPTVPPNDQDQQDKPAKLVDSIRNNIAHAVLHAQRITDKDVRKDKKAVKYNAAHAQHHICAAQDSLTALDDLLREVTSDPKAYAAQADALRKLQKKPVSTHPPKPLK